MCLQYTINAIIEAIMKERLTCFSHNILLTGGYRGCRLRYYLLDPSFTVFSISLQLYHG